jgi:hypothetical protein
MALRATKGDENDLGASCVFLQLLWVFDRAERIHRSFQDPENV